MSARFNQFSGLDLRERIEDGVTVDEAGCWLWQGVRFSRTGYAQFSVDNKTRSVHRVAYELYVGPIPDGLTVDHLCRVRNCVNPEHLEAVTARENILRGESPCAHNARKTHCPKGHPYDEGNTRWSVLTSGQRNRVCRICSRERQRKVAA